MKTYNITDLYVIDILKPTYASILPLLMWMKVLTTFMPVTSILTAVKLWNPTFARVTVNFTYLATILIRLSYFKALASKEILFCCTL